MIHGLGKIPINAICKWLTKTVTTTPPKYIEHKEFCWNCKLSSSELFYAVVLLFHDDVVQYQKFDANSAGNGVSLNLSFHPHNWAKSDVVHLSFFQNIEKAGSGVGFNVNSDELKTAPRKHVKIHIDKNSILHSGSSIDVASIDYNSGIQAKIMLISKADTEVTHSRWRLKKELLEAANIDYPFLKTGRLKGRICFSAQ